MGFFEGLEKNIRAASEEALLKSVVADPDQTVGQIMAALEGEDEAKYLLEAFKELTVGQVVHAAMKNIEATMQAESEDEAPEPEPEPVAVEAKSRNGVKPKKPSKKPPKKASKATKKDGDKALDLATPEAQKAYENAILKALRDGKHVDEDSGISNQNLRKIVGGTADQVRSTLNTLITTDRAGYYGQARGTKYYRY
jgi:hypothetical protein